MADHSAIGWTEATWNPTTGCKEISPGCKNCYAKTMSNRLNKMGKEKYKNNFEFTEHPNEIDVPLTWKKPRMIFVDSMSDLFFEKSRYAFNHLVFETMLKANQHIYQILTKRPQIMRDFVRKWLQEKRLNRVPEHIWLGVSVESQDYVNRIKILKTIPSKRFISFEPLLGNIDTDLTGIHWTIAGGESGAGYREPCKEWITSIRDMSERFGIPFYFKQWGGRWPTQHGRTLDHKTYDNFPQIMEQHK